MLDIILYRALESPCGIAIATTNPYQCRQAIYALRKQLKDADLLSLKICTSRDDPLGELWIVKGDVEDVEGE